jgi:hypothetical protein
LLYNNDVWTKKYRCNLTKGYTIVSAFSTHAQRSSIRGQRGHKDEGLISDLAETFDNLTKFKMKLNPEKCTFGVPLEKLLGCMVSYCRIDPNREKVSAITKMKPPESVHDVQKLMRCMAALSKFISQLSVRGLPFFKLLKNRTSSTGFKRHKRPLKT